VFDGVREIFVVRHVHLTAVLLLDLSVVSLTGVILTIRSIPLGESRAFRNEDSVHSLLLSCRERLDVRDNEPLDSVSARRLSERSRIFEIGGHVEGLDEVI
jgi:hypothetical protein